jgi:trigger factor
LSTETTEHKNDHYAVQVERDPGCKITFTITVSPEATKKEHTLALKGVNKQVSLPGFRKGRAPNELIIKHYAQHVEKEWKEALLQKAFQEAMKLADTVPYTRESVRNADVKSCSLEEGCTVMVKFEAMPDVPDVNVSELSIEIVEIEPVTEKKIEQIIEDIRYQFADWEVVEERPIEDGDFVDVDIENLDDEGTFICQDTRLEVVKEKMGSWLFDLLVGMSPGDDAEALSSLDEGQDASNFKPTNCRVTVKNISKSVLPELDDALAEKAGVKDAEELRSKVVTDLETLHEKQAMEKKRVNLKKSILEKHFFEVPASLVDQEAQRLMVQRMAEVSNSIPEGETLDEEKISELQKSVRKEVEDSYCWQFIINEIAHKEQIEVDKSEMSNEMMRHMYSMQQAGQQLDPNEKPEELMRQIYSHLLNRNVADYLLGKLG